MSAPSKTENTPYQKTILRALNLTRGWNIYLGTVPEKVTATRRRRNKAARAARRISRKAGAR